MGFVFRLLIVFILLIAFAVPGLCQSDADKLIVDDIQVDVQGADFVDSTGRLTVELFLISTKRNPREFKLNTFSSQVFDEQYNAYFYSEMRMGKVLVLIAQRENYIHYLLQPDVPVPFQITIGDWVKGKAPDFVKLVFEDSEEEGKFIEALIKIPPLG